MTKTIVVVGITGIQGSSVARTFLNLAGWHVRGISRNPSSPAAQALIAEGADIVQGDLDHKQSLFRPFEGANVIFSNTDFFIPFFTAIASGDPSPATVAFDIEVTQGVNIAEAAAQPIVLQTLEHFIYSSLSDPQKWSGGKVNDVYHFNSKAETIRQTESRFPEVAAKMSTVQIGHYVTNWKAHPSLAPQKQADGTFVVKRPLPVGQVFPFVDTQKDTGEFVRALVEMPPGKSLIGSSQDMTLPEWTKLWGDVLGVQAVYEQVGEAEFMAGAPQLLREEIWANFKYVIEYGYAGGDPDVLSVSQLDQKLKLTSMEDYIKSEDWSSIL